MDEYEEIEETVLRVSPSLMMRLFEYVKETEGLEDEDLHELVEIMTYLSDEQHSLDMSEYDLIVGNETHEDYEDDVNEEFEAFLEAKKMKNNPCWDDYEMVGHKMKDGRKVPNCVPVKESTEKPGIYSLIGKGNFGPAHPLHDPRVMVYVDGKHVHTASSGKEGHLWALERGHRLPDDHHLHGRDSYEDLKSQVRYRRAGL